MSSGWMHTERETHLLAKDESDFALPRQIPLLDAHEGVVLLTLAEGSRMYVGRKVAEGGENTGVECALLLAIFSRI